MERRRPLDDREDRVLERESDLDSKLGVSVRSRVSRSPRTHQKDDGLDSLKEERN